MKSTEKLDKVREMLPFGAISEVARRAGVEYQTVSRVLKGKSRNFKVMMALTEYIIELKEIDKVLYDAYETYAETVS